MCMSLVFTEIVLVLCALFEAALESNHKNKSPRPALYLW